MNLERQGSGTLEGIKGRKILRQKYNRVFIKKFFQCRSEVKLWFGEKSKH
jgi:hypothetical protein